MELKILHEINTEIREVYTEFLLQQPNSLFYQSLPYHELLKELLGCQSIYFTYWKNSKPIACLPFLYKQDERMGTVLNSLPYYGSNGSFVFDSSLSESDRNQIKVGLIEAFESSATCLNASAYTVITNPLAEDDWATAGLQFDYSDYRIGQITLLPYPKNNIEQELLKIFSDPRPRNIRRARNAGITIEIRHDYEALSFLFGVHKQNIESIGGKAKKREFFEMIPKFFTPQEYAVYVACKKKTPVAALLLFYFNKTVEYFTPATIPTFRNDQPSALLIFEAMKDAIAKGFAYWNWGGTWKTQQGVYDFKKRWGAVDLKYNYYSTVLNKNLLKINREDLTSAFSDFYLFPF
ncbi:MAG TPA: peptidoglycan bridge formation glycyltransferase FemA/FemB family protein, partial [Chitinophagales bacterium]|nr:peptidoglycan bridge formation glycyltransferase FemA/FemB family protein [Chitinophagales bacterium]